jgi:hypothetical protein
LTPRRSSARCCAAAHAGPDDHDVGVQRPHNS